MNIRVLLTGGTGFFGRALLSHFLATDMRAYSTICVLSRDPERFRNIYPELVACENVTLVRADIEDRKSLPWGQTFTHVLHAAADSTLGPKLLPLHRFHQIVAGTTNVLDLAVSTGANRFLLTSSGGIYGSQPPDLLKIPEEWPGCLPLDCPSSAYSQAKRAAEHLCALYRSSYGLQTIIARCFAFIGTDLPLDVHFAAGNFIRDALYEDAVVVAGDGTPLRTYLDQRDLARFLWTLLMHGHDGETYNVGSDREVSISQLAHLVRDLLAPEKPVRILGAADPSAARNRYVPCINKIQMLHDMRVEISLEQAILSAANAHRNSNT